MSGKHVHQGETFTVEYANCGLIVEDEHGNVELIATQTPSVKPFQVGPWETGDPDLAVQWACNLIRDKRRPVLELKEACATLEEFVKSRS